MIKATIKILKCIGLSIRDTVVHDGVEHAGYLSFLLMLAIFPFLVFFMALTGFVGNEYIANILVEMILQSEWAKFIDALKPRILEITQSPPESLLTIAIVSAIWTASSIFEGIRTVLNRANRVSTPPSYLFRRFISIVEFLVAIFIIMSFVIFMVVLPNIIGFLDSYIPLHEYVFQFLSPESKQMRYYLILGFMFFIISFSYKSLPNKKIRFRSVIPGALVVLVGWSVFAKLFKGYITIFPQVNLIYGSIAGVIVALIYFYACSIIYIFGAQLNFHIQSKFSHLRK